MSVLETLAKRALETVDRGERQALRRACLEERDVERRAALHSARRWRLMGRAVVWAAERIAR
jgi:hypothetical protein